MTAEEFATYKSMEVLVEGAYGLPSAFAAPQPLTCMPRRVVLVVLGSVAIDFFLSWSFVVSWVVDVDLLNVYW